MEKDYPVGPSQPLNGHSRLKNGNNLNNVLSLNDSSTINIVLIETHSCWDIFNSGGVSVDKSW